MPLASRQLFPRSTALWASLVLLLGLIAPRSAYAQQTISTVMGGPVTNVPATSLGSLAGDFTSLAFFPNGDLLVGNCTLLYRVTSAGSATTIAGNGEGCYVDPAESGVPGDGGPALGASLAATGLAIDPAGNIYLADASHNTIREIAASTGIITTIAGTGTAGYSGDGGPAAEAEFNMLAGLVRDSAGDLFVADKNNDAVREISASGVVSTVAQVPTPQYLALDNAGHLFIGSNHPGQISELTLATGALTVVAGTGTMAPATGVPAASASFVYARGIAVDGAGDLFIAAGAGAATNRVFELPAGSQDLTVVAGGGASFSATGAATASLFTNVRQVATDASGDLYISTSGSSSSGVGEDYVFRIASDGSLNVVFGNGAPVSQGATLPALSSLIVPGGLDASNGLTLADPDGARVLALSGGTLTSLVGTGVAGYSGDGGPATTAELASPQSVVRDRAGDMFIADENEDEVRRVDGVTGIITTYAGNGTAGYSGDGGPATSAELNLPQEVALDAAGNLYIGDVNNGVVRKVAAGTGIITTYAGDGEAFVTQSGDGGPATSAEFNDISGLAVDAAGDLYISDSGFGTSNENWLADGAVREVNVSTGIITTVAGLGQANSDLPGYGDGGPATLAALTDTIGIALDPAGNLYIADYGAAEVREVIAATGIIEKLAGTNQLGGDGGDGGPAAQATLRPCTLAFDPSGNLYVGDCDADYIREISNGDGRPTLSAPSLSFGTQPVGTASTANPVTVTNPGIAPDAIGAIALSGGAAADYSFTTTCGASLPAGAACTVTVTFTPMAAGDRPATLTVPDGYGGLTLSLDGAGAVPVAALSPASLSFAATEIGLASAAQTVTLSNPGAAPLAIGAISATVPFQVISSCGSGLAVGASCNLAVSFAPTAAGAATGTLSVSDNASGSPQTVALSGAGLALPTLTAAPAALGFASQPVGTPSPALDVVISNPSAVPALFSGISASGDFISSSSCGASLAAGAQCVVEVSFDPASLGALTGTLSISSNAGNSPLQVALSGAGIQSGVTLAPGGLNFGGQQVGSTSSPLNLTVTSTGTAPLTISAAAASAGFAVTGSCPTVQPGASCSFGVSFSPTAVGAAAGTLTLTDNAGGGTQTVPLSGLGTAPGAAVLPTSLNFGAVLVGTSSYAQTVTLANTGTAALASLAIPSQAGDFAVSNTGADACGSSLAAGAACSFAVNLTPSAAGADTATLTIGDSLGAQAVALAGTGLAPGVELSATQLNFGSEDLGETSFGQTVTLTNTGNTALTISAISSSDPGYAETDNCLRSSPLEAGASCGINVAFTPLLAGADSAILNINDSAGGHAVALNGEGVVGLSLSPSALDFGSQELGGVSPQQTINVSNTGTTPFTLTTFQASGDFQVSQNLCTAELAPGGACQIFVTYAPSALGASVGSITLADDSGAIAGVVALRGAGTQPGISASPSTLAFGATPVNTTSSAQTVTITNSGTATLNIEAITAPEEEFTVSGTTCLGAGGAAQALAAGASCVVNVTMTPATYGTRSGSLLIANDADGTLDLALTGSGASPIALLEPGFLTFGSQPIPGAGITVAGQPQTVTLTNTGDEPMTIFALGVTGGFNQNNNCGSTLAPLASCTINISFNPTATGQWVGYLVLGDTAPNGSQGGNAQVVSLDGFGSPNGLTLSPSVLNFGGLVVGQTSPPQTVTLTNGTNQAIGGLAITASGQFNQTNNCPATLAQGASCTISVTVTPQLSGNLTGQVSVSGSLAGSGTSPELRAGTARANAGTKVGANAEPGVLSAALNIGQIAVSSNGDPAALSVSASSLGFASEPVGAASAAQTLTVTNSSAATAVTGLTLASTPDFPITTTCTATLAPAANCGVSVEFQPVSAGNRTGTLSITGAGGLSSTVSLSGAATGGTLAANPSTLAFGARAQGTVSAAQTVTLSNTGTASFALQAFTSSNPDFTVAASTCGALPAVLAANASCTVGVVFQPSTASTESATLTIASNASNGNAVVGLSGSGSNQGLTLEPTYLTFAAQGVGSAGAAQTVRLTNNSGATVALGSIAVTGANPSDFVQTNTCGSSLATSANCVVSVAFTPSASGARAATLNINDAAGDQTVALSGGGSDFSLALGAAPAVTAGQTASLPLALASLAGDTQVVTLACTVDGVGTSCAVMPASVSISGSAQQSATVQVTTEAPQFGVAVPPQRRGPRGRWLEAAAAALLGLVGWWMLGDLRQRRRRWKLALLGAVLVLGAACGGVSNEPTAPGTGAATLTVHVTATSSNGVVHTATATVQVNARL